MSYFNQNWYKGYGYPSPELPGATIQSGGCGVCCGAMIVTEMTENSVDPVEMADISMGCGARVSGGTDMNTLADELYRRYGLTCEATADEDKLLAHLHAGGMAVANVGGDYSGHTGVFSSSGHFIVVKAANGTALTIMDPNTYINKFNKKGRNGKVSVNGDMSECYCDISVLRDDCANRNPSYWLFMGVKGVINMALEAWQRDGGQAALQVLKEKGLITKPEVWNTDEKLAAPVPSYLFWMMLRQVVDRYDAR